MKQSQLFYYFFESESNNAEEDPIVLWLTGGPGCSGLSAILYEVGPFTIDYAKSYGSTIPTLKVNDNSWTKVANIIFLDQPVGTGFSYSETHEGYYSGDTKSATHTYDFLRKWLINNPKYLNNPLYISGDSYSGIILPQVVEKVYDGIDLGSQPPLNMKGYSLGNPVTDKYIDNNGKIPYAHRMGLLSDRLYQSAKELCHGNYSLIDMDNILCQKILGRVNECLDKVRIPHILEPWCGTYREEEGYVVSRHVISYKAISTNFLQSDANTTKYWCREDNYVFSATWANDISVQKALYIREGTIKEKAWSRCNNSIRGSKTQPDGSIPYVFDVTSAIGYHRTLTYKSCRALVYSGDHDFSVPHTTTEKWIDSLSLPIRSDWRPWFVKGQVAGYTTTYGHGEGAYELTYATVKGAGHLAPEYKPVESLAMIRRWFGQNAL